MTHHGHILRELYGYLRDELPADDAARLREHLAHCTRCAEACEDLRTTLGHLEPLRASPSGDLPDAYWEKFLRDTVAAAQAGRTPVPPPKPRLLEELAAAVASRRRWIVATGGGAIAVGLLLLFLPGRAPDPSATVPAPPVRPAARADDDLDAYLRRSRSLLVSLTNAPVSGEPFTDLALERSLSRELVSRGRAFDGGTLDPRSAHVVHDLQKVLIELANLDSASPEPDVRMLLDGIRERNLLFRLRMVEAVRDSISLLRASAPEHRE